MRYFLLSVLAVLFLAACGVARPLELSTARSYCNTAGDGGSSGSEDSGSGSCKEQLDICARFFDPLAAGITDQASCLAKCSEARAELFHVHVVDDCRFGLNSAQDLCEQYCRGNFH